MKKFNKEIQIAAVAILGVIVLYYGMQFLKGLTISSGSNYYVKFNDISGLSNSCPVYANGYKVGVVEDIIYDYDNQENIVAVLGVNNELHVPQGTKADIVSDFLGNIKLVLKLGDRAAGFMTPGDTIVGGQDQGWRHHRGRTGPGGFGQGDRDHPTSTVAAAQARLHPCQRQCPVG